MIGHWNVAKLIDSYLSKCVFFVSLSLYLNIVGTEDYIWFFWNIGCLDGARTCDKKRGETGQTTQVILEQKSLSFKFC